MLSASNAAALRYNYQANQASTDAFTCFFSGFGILYGLCIDGWSAWWYLYFMIGGWQSYIKRQGKDMFGNPGDGFPIEGKFIFATIADTISGHRKNGGFVPSFWIIKTTWRRIRFLPVRCRFLCFPASSGVFFSPQEKKQAFWWMFAFYVLSLFHGSTLPFRTRKLSLAISASGVSDRESE